MAEESYEGRIAAAEDELARAVIRRDHHYPGSPEWESAEAKRREWQRTLEDLRRAQAS